MNTPANLANWIRKIKHKLSRKDIAKELRAQSPRHVGWHGKKKTMRDKSLRVACRREKVVLAIAIAYIQGLPFLEAGGKPSAALHRSSI